MKRSVINRAYRDALACLARHHWALPPRPRWDITDFGNTAARILHLGYLLLLDELDRLDANRMPRALDVLHGARSAGLRTSLDCVSENSDRFRTVVMPVLGAVDVPFANDFEAEKLTGIRLQHEGDCDAAGARRAAGALIAAGVREWAIIHLPEAVFAHSADGQSLWQPSVRVPPGDIRGAAGAGDAFAAGVLLGLHDNWQMAPALELGVCAAAASLLHPTCSESLRPAVECVSMGRQLGYRTASEPALSTTVK